MNTQKEMVEKIRNDYMEKEITKLDELKALDKKVKRPAQVFAYVFGSIGSLILGTGMCFAMKVIGQSISWLMPVGIVVGLIGILMVSINYAVYKSILKRRKNKYSNKIFELTDSLLNN